MRSGGRGGSGGGGGLAGFHEAYEGQTHPPQGLLEAIDGGHLHPALADERRHRGGLPARAAVGVTVVVIGVAVVGVAAAAAAAAAVAAAVVVVAVVAGCSYAADIVICVSVDGCLCKMRVAATR